MKTHELAKALTQLSRVLKAGPNIEFEELTNLSTYLSAKKPPRSVPKKAVEASTTEQGAGLALLAQMANYKKQDLIALADVLEIPLEIRPADAVRDVLGKILKYINENPEVKERLSQTDSRQIPESTSSLAQALSILMSQG
ncbi:hypothetical protein GS624_01095 [Ruegeria sp. HKCCD5849]|uniref:hypothetical protein n=1 Tax=unclassified Ruegeria TaxID=2625375 RepID=UPI001492E8BD|nr:MULTISPECIES: hypothetical protein [unclassified Ruegeria]NOD45900.1 hypothetical protein [Ruegeria sp. HKCCD5849]NOD50800.1 hypothetical protein [Ruegeria sp. HKCCD5851]